MESGLSVGVQECSVSGWQAERHVFYGDSRTIAGKLEAGRLNTRRRLYYVVLAAEERATVYELEHSEGSVYSVRAADTEYSVANEFSAEAERAMFETKGDSCVGRAIQGTATYQQLRLEPVGETSIEHGGSFAFILPMDDSRRGADTFYQFSVFEPC